MHLRTPQPCNAFWSVTLVKGEGFPRCATIVTIAAISRLFLLLSWPAESCPLLLSWFFATCSENAWGKHAVNSYNATAPADTGMLKTRILLLLHQVVRRCGRATGYLHHLMAQRTS